MITGNIRDFEKYFEVHKDFKEAFELLKELNKDSKIGEIKGQNVLGSVSETITSDKTKDDIPKPFEAHRKFIDIHYIIDGIEKYGYANIAYLTPITEYHDDGDYILFKGEANKITLNTGDFCIVFPEDAHIPAMGNGTKVKRSVLKVMI